MHNEQERLANGLFGDCREERRRALAEREEGKRDREREGERWRDRMCEREGGLGVSAGRYPEWQTSTTQSAASNHAGRDERE